MCGICGKFMFISNESDTIRIIFNGEIYNYQALRQALLQKGHVFKTKTDTEVILHLYEDYGAECVKKLRGMFAFAIWDDPQKTLLLARDRVGIKPLYYYQSDQCLIFASEIKAILADPEVKREIAPEVIDRFLTFFYVPGSETLIRNIRKLPPGSFLLVRNGRAEVHSFATERTGKKISTYTVGFSDPTIADERPYARLAAKSFGTEHHEMTISARDFADFLPQYAWHMEEPVCEPPAIALYFVSKLASSHVKVLLSGEGGDEAFAGYSNYRNTLWFERLKRLLGPLNGVSASILSPLNALLRSPRIAKYIPLTKIRFEDYYYSRTSGPLRYFNSQVRGLYSTEFARQTDKQWSLGPIRQYLSNVKGRGLLDRMLYLDTKTWLPDDLLVKADKMTMANSVELRVPLLDHRVLEFAASLPANQKVRWFTTKYIAKKALTRRVPREILQRRKAGFPVPYESWLRKDLRSMVHDILLDTRTASRGYFNERAVKELVLLNEQTGEFSKEIFSLITLELWHRVFLEQEAVPVPSTVALTV